MEKQAKLKAEALRELRQRESVPILDELRSYLAGLEAQMLPKSPLGTAVGYAQRRWAALNVYVTDGRRNIDNNPAERAMRPVAVGRKNWLFVQQLQGGRRMATILSLVAAAEEIGVNPVVYLRDVLQRIGREPDVSKLTPHGWREHFEAEVEARRANATRQLLGQ